MSSIMGEPCLISLKLKKKNQKLAPSSLSQACPQQGEVYQQTASDFNCNTSSLGVSTRWSLYLNHSTGFSSVSILPAHPTDSGLSTSDNHVNKSLKSNFFVYTTTPSFSKVCFMPLHLHERSTLVPVFTNQQKSEEAFHF